jgi:hypothetical protein
MGTVPKWIKATNPYFYRYQSAAHLDRLQTIILQHELYVPLVGQLNDPADGRPKLAEMSARQMLAFLSNASRNPTLTNAAQKQALEILESAIQVRGVEEIRRQAARLLNEHVEHYRVLSLTKRYDNLSLWAKYAADHTGYCLEFVNEGPFFAEAIDVIYGETIPMDVSNPEYPKNYFFYCKRQEWSNEEEIRLIGLPTTPAIVKIDPRWLTRIILGKDMSPDHEKQIREWAKQRQPELTIDHAYFDELDLELRLRS